MDEYNLYAYDEFIGTYTLDDLSLMLKIPADKIVEAEKNKKGVIGRKYRVGKIYQSLNNYPKALMEEWERVTAIFRNYAKKRKGAK